MGRTLVVGIAVVLAAGAVTSRDVAASDDEIKITVTNITRGQIISPVVVATHKRGLAPIFRVGFPASAEVAKVAEDALLADLIASLEADGKVKDVQTLTGAGGPIMPGESASVVVEAKGRKLFVSMVAMLVTTNDAFFGLNAAKVPRHGSASYYSPAYDAGSEGNNEDCGFIPGPPCGDMGQNTTDGEGYVHIHAGVHGIGDLDPADFDWRNPVAKVTIQRVDD